MCGNYKSKTSSVQPRSRVDMNKIFDEVDIDSSDITGILAQMIDDPSTCPLPYYRAPNTDD